MNYGLVDELCELVDGYCDIYDACDDYYDIYDACDDYYDIYIMPVFFLNEWGFLNAKNKKNRNKLVTLPCARQGGA
jgi:hypothetical protein